MSYIKEPETAVSVHYDRGTVASVTPTSSVTCSKDCR